LEPFKIKYGSHRRIFIAHPLARDKNNFDGKEADGNEEAKGKSTMEGIIILNSELTSILTFPDTTGLGRSMFSCYHDPRPLFLSVFGAIWNCLELFGAVFFRGPNSRAF
jgi:hypothetical protein